MTGDYRLAEQCCIGSILISPETLEIVRGIVKASDFSDERIKGLYTAACKLADQGETIDPVTVKAEAGDSAVTDEFIVQCMDITVTAANAKEYAEAVHDAALGRQVRDICMEVATDVAGNSKELINQCISQLQMLQAGGTNDLAEPFEVAKRFYLQITDMERTAFTSTGYKSLDGALAGGLIESGMIAIAARPGVGKTLLGLCVADNVAAQGKPVLYVSLEMSENQIMCRRVGRLSGVSYNALQKGRIPSSDRGTLDKVGDALSQIMSRQFYILDKPSTLSDIEIHARAIKNLGLIVIDHLGLVKSDLRGKRYEVVTEISHGVKRLAISMGIPIVALCQLNRENEGRNDKKPRLSDLRDSGAIEEDCDAVMLLHRPLKDEAKAWESQPLEVEVAKNRHGYPGRAELTFYGLTARIIEEERVTDGQIP